MKPKCNYSRVFDLYHRGPGPDAPVSLCSDCYGELLNCEAARAEYDPSGRPLKYGVTQMIKVELSPDLCMNCGGLPEPERDMFADDAPIMNPS